jgi:excisionase family DNA binding protein
MNEQKAPATLTVKEVQTILKLGTNSAYNLIHSKAFPVKKVGHSYRIPSEPFFKWLDVQPHGYVADKI